MFCPKCGSSNDAAAKSCRGCGNALTLTAASAQAEEPASDEACFRAVVGEKDPDYYLDRFDGFVEDRKIGPTWNWSAFFVTFYWLLYRKMWRNAAIYIALPIILLLLFWIVRALAGGAVGIVVSLGGFVYLAAIFVVMPLYANALYYQHCIKLIETVRSTTQGTQKQLDELAHKGGTSRQAGIAIAAVNAVVFLGILAAIAIPAYQDANAKARLVQALTVGKAATSYVDGYYSQYRSLPSNLDAANFMMSLPPYVSAVRVDNQAGTISITMKGGAAIDGKSLKFVTGMTGGDRLNWACMSDDIQDRYLPLECSLRR